MCGLVGMAGNIILSTHGKMFRDMLLFDSVRGMDSTGVALVPLNQTLSVQIQKELGGPTNLFELSTNTLLNLRGIPTVQSRCLIGHNRAATLGAVSVNNAHPFTYGHITGAHNGTLIDWYELEGYKESDVDSQSIFLTIEKKGIDHCWKSFRGDAAISYWDDNEQTMNFVRNTGRTLFYGFNKEKDVLFWASEQWMISVAANRNNIQLETITNKNGELVYNIQMFKPDHLHSFNIGSSSATLKEVRELEKKPEPSALTMGYGTNYGRTGNGSGTSYSHQNYTKKDISPQAKINAGWSADAEKGPKELRGQTVALDYYIEGISKLPFYYIVGWFRKEDGSKGERIVIYPSTYGEFLIWKSRVDNKNNGCMYKTMARPRSMPANSVWKEYRIAANHVKPVDVKVVETKETKTASKKEEKKSGVTCLYRGPNGVMMTEEEFNIALRIVSKDGCCTGCSNPIDINDDHKLLWYDGVVVFCEDCQKDDVIMGYLNMAAKGA